MRRGAAAAQRTLSHAVAKQKTAQTRRGGPGDPGPAGRDPPPPRRDRPPFEALGALGALGSLGENQCPFQKYEKYTLSLKLST